MPRVLGLDPISGLVAGFVAFLVSTAMFWPAASPAAPAWPASAPAPAEAAEPAMAPGWHAQAAGSVTLLSPLASATVTSPSVVVQGRAAVGNRALRLAVVRGGAVLGSVDLDLVRPGPFEAVVPLGLAPLVGRVRLVVTEPSRFGVVVLATRELWICSTCA